MDDEQRARNLLENLLLRFCPEVEVLARCREVKEAVAAINEMKPDVVFLDIEMPHYAGYEIVQFFKEIPFEIIFVTAYERYAIRAFEVAAIDYLLKPIDIARLRLAVKRVQEKKQAGYQTERMELLGSTLKSRQIKNIVISDKKQQHIIPIESIVAIEAQESYCIIHTLHKKIMASKNLKHFENVLQDLPVFFRTHKSWLINKNHISHYKKANLSIILSDGLVAKLSRYKINEFEAAITS